MHLSNTLCWTLKQWSLRHLVVVLRSGVPSRWLPLLSWGQYLPSPQSLRRVLFWSFPGLVFGLSIGYGSHPTPRFFVSVTTRVRSVSQPTVSWTLPIPLISSSGGSPVSFIKSPCSFFLYLFYTSWIYFLYIEPISFFCLYILCFISILSCIV